MRRDPSKPLTPGKRHPRSVRIKAYKYWTRCHKISEVYKQLKEDGYYITVATLVKWRDTEDWEGRQAVQSNELRRILRQSDDPILKQLVMDDLEYVKVLRALRGIVTTVLKQPRRHGLKPRSIKEVLELVKFLRVEREALLGAVNAKAAEQPVGNVRLTYNDNRKIDLGNKLRSLPPEQLGHALDQLGEVANQKHPMLEEARKQIIDVKAS